MAGSTRQAGSGGESPVVRNGPANRLRRAAEQQGLYMKSKPIAVFTTAGILEDARKLASTLIEQKLAACAQISEIQSFYAWKNKIQNDQEFRIIFKTTKDKYKDVEKAILKIHSYDLPAIYAVDVDELYKPYGDWVNESLK